MSRILLIAGSAFAALSLTACGQKAEEVPVTDAAVVEAPPVAAVPAAMTAPDFVNMAAASDMFELEAAKVAQSKATNAEVKAFAAEMVTAHTKSMADLNKAIADSGQTLTPPAAMPADKQARLDALNAAPNFDKAYIDGQVMAHQEALAMLQGYATAGEVPTIKAFASATAPVVQQHLDQAIGLQSKMN